MKILNLNDFISEKKSISPLTIKQIKSIKSEIPVQMSAYTIIHKIFNSIDEHCLYEKYGADGPINAGDLLRKYGALCGYCFRDKDVKVNQDKFNNNRIVIQWVAQEYIEQEPFCEMMSEMIKLANINLGKYELYLQATSRDNWDFDNPDYEFVYDEDSGKFETV